MKNLHRAHSSERRKRDFCNDHSSLCAPYKLWFHLFHNPLSWVSQGNYMTIIVYEVMRSAGLELKTVQYNKAHNTTLHYEEARVKMKLDRTCACACANLSVEVFSQCQLQLTGPVLRVRAQRTTARPQHGQCCLPLAVLRYRRSRPTARREGLDGVQLDVCVFERCSYSGGVC